LARLLVRAGAEPGREIGLPEDGAEIKVGRLPGLAITLLDTKVSREHCRIYRQSTGWIVEDLESRNGTYVNAQKIKKRLLQPGDRLRVGQTEFEYSTATAGTPAPAAAMGAPAGVPPPSTPAEGPAIPPLRSTKKIPK
jgi:pSer/pThr/pTyr-binding forkhead associated (FHA) protein